MITIKITIIPGSSIRLSPSAFSLSRFSLGVPMGTPVDYDYEAIRRKGHQ
jgi:hypothetical protein